MHHQGLRVLKLLGANELGQLKLPAKHPKKKKRKRKNNNTNRYIEEMIKKGSSGLINKQLTNFIDNLSI